MDIQTAAPVMYPDPAPSPVSAAQPAEVAPAAAPAAAPVENEQVPEDEQTPEATDTALAPDLPDAIKALRAERARVLFSAQVTFKDVIPDDAFVSDQVDATKSAAAAGELREVMGDLGLQKSESIAIVEAMRSHDTNLTMAEAADSVVAALNGEFGTNARTALRAAQQLVARDPRVASMLAAGNLGNNPKVVLQIAKAAMRERGGGRL